MRVLCFGASITQGFWDTQGGWVQRIRNRFDTEVITGPREGFGQEYTGVFNLGVDANLSADVLRRVEAETRARKSPKQKLITMVALGASDSSLLGTDRRVSPEEFQTNLQQIAEVLKELSDTVILMGNPACDEDRTTPVSWGNYYYYNSEIERAERIISSVATAESVRFVPIYEAFKARLDAGGILLADGLHPNDAGHELIATIVWPVLAETIRSLKTV